MAQAKTPVIVRKLEASDRDAWQRLWTDYLTFYNASVEAEVYDVTFERLLGNDAQDYHCFVADLDGELVGLTHYLFHRHNWRIENVIYLQDLYADPEVRGKGIGRALIEAVYAAGDSAGCSSVYWLTQDDNHEAQKLYDRIAVKTNFIKYQRP